MHTSRIPALTRSAEGTLLCAYDLRRAGGGPDLQEDIDIGLSRSLDGGRTWEPPRVIMDMGEYGGLPQSQNGCSDPTRAATNARRPCWATARSCSTCATTGSGSARWR